MGKIELEMKHSRLPLTTRYATYRTGPPEHGIKHMDNMAVMQIFVKDLKNYAGKLPENLKVTIEWNDYEVGEDETKP